MIRHIYLIKLKEGADVQAAIEKMMSLKEHIPYMKAIECGVDFKGDSNSWEVCEMCTFETREDFIKFGADPYHAEVRQYMSGIIAQGAKIDYEV